MSHSATGTLPTRELMPASQPHRQSKTCPQWVLPPRQMTNQDCREDMLLDMRLHQLFGPPATIHRGGVVDWSGTQRGRVTRLWE